MGANKSLFLTALILVISIQLLAQEDTTFINNYKRFRSLVDSYSSYCIYLVPFQSSQKISINEGKNFFKEAYHFLEGKRIIKKTPDVLILVLIDSLEIDYPTDRLIGSDKNYLRYQISTNYRLSFNLLIYTTEGKRLLFPLCINKELKKERYVSVQTELPKSANSADYDNINKYMASRCLEFIPEVDDMKFELYKILEQYKNYYVDRVD